MHKWRYFLSERWLLTLLSGLEWSLSCIPGRTSCSPPDLLCIFHLNIRIVWLCYLQKIHRLACSYSALRFLSFILIAPCKILMFHQFAYCYLWLPAVKRLLQFLPFWWNYKDKKKKKERRMTSWLWSWNSGALASSPDPLTNFLCGLRKYFLVCICIAKTDVIIFLEN